MVKRRSEKTKGSKEKQSNFNTQKTKKLRTDLFILNACIIIINSNKQNDFLSILKAVNVTFWRPTWYTVNVTKLYKKQTQLIQLIIYKIDEEYLF